MVTIKYMKVAIGRILFVDVVYSESTDRQYDAARNKEGNLFDSNTKQTNVADEAFEVYNFRLKLYDLGETSTRPTKENPNQVVAILPLFMLVIRVSESCRDLF